MSIRKTLRNAALISGYSVIAWGLWAMPAPAGSLNAILIGANCQNATTVAVYTVKMHDDEGWSVGETKRRLVEEGLPDSPVNAVAFSLAQLAIVAEYDRAGLKETLWQECVEGVS